MKTISEIVLVQVDYTYSDTWQTRSDALNDLKYDEYLKSDEWKKVKRRASKRKFYQACLKCGSTIGIELHHRTYKWIGTPNAMTGLIPLCRTHHEEVHQYAKKSRVSVRIATNEVCKEAYLKMYRK